MTNNKIKINITKPFLPPKEEYFEEIERVWGNNWLTNNGPLHSEFEDEIKDYLKVKNASLFVNGHSALDIAIKTLDLEGEVITTPFTFASTTHAISGNGLKPVFCDIEIDTYNIDVSKMEDLITEKTSAIIPVHVFGNPCDVEAIDEIAKKHDLKVIYDAAHAFGVEVDGEGIGNFGDISMFSLHATKVFHSIEGGVLTFNNDKYKEKFEALKNFGKDKSGEVSHVGLNAKMNEFQAAMGLVNLRYINQEISKRKKVSYKYRELLEEVKGIRVLKDIKYVKHNYSYFPILVDENKFGLDRDELFNKLKEYNVFARKYFYPLCSEFEYYKNNYDAKYTPNAKYVTDRIIALPIYGSLDINKVVEICRIIKNSDG